MIWCVEDDDSIRDIELYALKSAGFEVRGFEEGLSFWEELKKGESPELIVLDIMLPNLDGITLLKRIKNSGKFKDIPVIMATAKGKEYDKIQGLDLGADYYLNKPFGVMEFVSCVKAVLRRYPSRENEGLIKNGELVLDKNRRTVTLGEEKILLTFKEFELLYLFLTNSDMVFTREMLYDKIWGADYIGESRTVDMHIRTLRKKLKDYGDIIETVRNVGYRMGEHND